MKDKDNKARRLDWAVRDIAAGAIALVGTEHDLFYAADDIAAAWTPGKHMLVPNEVVENPHTMLVRWVRETYDESRSEFRV